MQKATLIVRLLLGALFVFSSVSFFLNACATPELSEPMQALMTGMLATKYMLPLVKALELICGIALIVGRFVPLATVILFPITVNIVLIHLFIEPNGIPMALAILVANLFLAYAHKESYKALLES